MNLDDGVNEELLTAVEDNQSLFDIIQHSLDLTLLYTQKQYVLYDNYGKICLKDCDSLVSECLIDKETMQSYSYKRSIDTGTANRIKLVYSTDSGEQTVFLDQDQENINKWGVLQHYESINDTTFAADRVQNLLAAKNQVYRHLKISGAWGDISVRAGYNVPVVMDLGDMQVSQFMLVEEVTHKWDNGMHTMDLTLSGKGGFAE